MPPDEEQSWFDAQREAHEAAYLAAADPRGQSGFWRDAVAWERCRRPIAAAIHRPGAFLDVGCASGLLMESVVRWVAEVGHAVEPYGLDISPRLAELARIRLPRWRDRVFIGNALYWEPPRAFDFVRTELVYVPHHRRREYVERLLGRMVAPGGRLVVCSYGSGRKPSPCVEPIADDLAVWGYAVGGVAEAADPETGVVVTRVAWIERAAELAAVGPMGESGLREDGG